jgi:hypothetical protein
MSTNSKGLALAQDRLSMPAKNKFLSSAPFDVARLPKGQKPCKPRISEGLQANCRAATM